MLEQVFFEGEFVADFEVVDVQSLRDETDRPREALLHRCVLKNINEVCDVMKKNLTIFMQGTKRGEVHITVASICFS